MSCGALYVKKKLHEGAVAIGDGDILPILDHRQQAMRTVTLQVEGISGDTIVPKVSIDGVTYYATQVLPVGVSDAGNVHHGRWNLPGQRDRLCVFQGRDYGMGGW